MEISPKKLRFCEEYVIDLNGAQAATRAGYSKKTAKEQATRLLTNVYVSDKIAALQAEISERNRLKVDDVIAELRKLAFWDVTDFIDKKNKIKNLYTIKGDKTKVVTGIKVKETKTGTGPTSITEVTTELKLADKRAALVDLGRHLGAFEKDNSQKTLTIKVKRK